MQQGEFPPPPPQGQSLAMAPMMLPPKPKPVRKCPQAPAKEFPPGTVMLGKDGRQWRAHVDPNGKARWVYMNPATAGMVPQQLRQLPPPPPPPVAPPPVQQQHLFGAAQPQRLIDIPRVQLYPTATPTPLVFGNPAGAFSFLPPPQPSADFMKELLAPPALASTNPFQYQAPIMMPTPLPLLSQQGPAPFNSQGGGPPVTGMDTG